MIKIKLSGNPKEIQQAQEYFQRLEDIGEIKITKIVDLKELLCNNRNSHSLFIRIEPEAIELLNSMSETTQN